MKEKIINGVVKFYDDSEKNRLMSSSGLSAFFNPEKFDNVDSFKLEKATNFGKDLMDYLERALRGQLSSIQELCGGEVKKAASNVLKWLLEHDLKVVGVEKHYSDKIWHGYIDLEVQNKKTKEYYFVEIKSRNNWNVEMATVIQTEIYKKITGLKCIILYFNKINKNDKIREVFPNENQIRNAKEIITKSEEIKKLWTK